MWGWLKRAMGLEPNRVRLVSAQISVDDNNRYFISLTRYHSQVQPFEYVRLLLHYYARVLFLFHPSDPKMMQSAHELIAIMRTIFQKRLDAGCHVFQRAGIKEAATVLFFRPEGDCREILATLYYLGKGQFYLQAQFPKKASLSNVAYSVPALLQSILPELDERSINVLNFALGKMNETYAMGRSFSSLEAMSAVPTEAFVSGAQLFGQPPSSPPT